MPSRYRFALTLPLLAALLAGCSSQNPLSGPGATSSSLDEAEVAATLGQDPSLVEDEVSESPDETSVNAAAAAAADLEVQAEIEPLRFWREIRSIDRRFDFNFSDRDGDGRPMTAVVTIHRVMRGSFNIRVAVETPEGGDPQTRVISKPLVDHAVRRVLLKRVRVLGQDRARWRVVATSGVEITSRGAATGIASLRIESGALDTTITDPLEFFRLRAVLKLEPGAEVKLTATTQADDDAVFLHLRGQRVRFESQGGMVHTVVFTAPDREGLHHIGVNALAHGTLYDDAAAYDSKAWIEPYVVHPLPIAEGTPEE